MISGLGSRKIRSISTALYEKETSFRACRGIPLLLMPFNHPTTYERPKICRFDNTIFQKILTFGCRLWYDTFRRQKGLQRKQFNTYTGV